MTGEVRFLNRLGKMRKEGIIEVNRNQIHYLERVWLLAGGKFKMNLTPYFKSIIDEDVASVVIYNLKHKVST